jgi:eukaryotic-like serine/threonine-protein kinase
MARANDETVAGPFFPGVAVRADDETVAGISVPDGSRAPAAQGRAALVDRTVGAEIGAGVARVDAGSRAGDYVLDAFIADGGFGVVYRAHHAEQGTPAAVKILHAELASQAEVVLRFEREVEAIRRVRHPNVVEVFSCGRLDDGRPYFAMELLAGASLEQYLRARGRVGASEALEILAPLCEALSAAHEQAIVHRDIKASNIFLAADADGRRRVVLLDFGVAKLLDASGPALTSSRHIVGTPSCMAPEQLQGRPVDARTDVYALGALAYLMLTGEPPFADSPYPLLHQMHLHASPPRPSSRSRVSPAFDDVVLRAMSKDPAARQKTAGSFLEEMQGALARSRQAGGPEEGWRERRALGVYIEVEVDPEALESADDHLLSDMEEILPLAASAMNLASFAVAFETGSSMLFVRDRPDDALVDEGARRGTVKAALELFRKVEARSGRNEGVRARVYVHAGALRVTEEGTLVGGGLLELAAWVPEVSGACVLASSEVLAGLGIEGQPVAEGAGGGGVFARL